MHTATYAAFEVALGDVENLIAHHPKSKTGGRGRPSSDEGPLNRSCILLLYAAWEVFAEDNLRWAVDQLTTRVADPEGLPAALRQFVLDAGGDPWALAGDGWRSTTREAVDRKVLGAEDGSSFGMNTAGPRQLDVLHRQVLGTSLIAECRWRNKTNKAVRSHLHTIVRLRGGIAHTGKAPTGKLSLQIVRNHKTFLIQLAGALDTRAQRWVDGQLASPATPGGTPDRTSA